MKDGRKKQERKLNEREKAFCREYIIDLNVYQAMQRAGYSQSTAQKCALRLLGRQAIQSELQSLLRPKIEKAGVTAERVIGGLAKIAFSKLQDVVILKPGSLSIKEEIPEDAQYAIDSVQISDTEHGSNIKVKMKDSKGALDTLAKYLGLLVEKHQEVPPDELAKMTDQELQDYIARHKAV